MTAQTLHSRERRSGPRVYHQVMVGGIETACVSRHQLGGLMGGDCLAARGGRRAPRLVFATNGHAIAMAALDQKFRKTFAKADLVHADGEPVVAASKLLTATPVPERSATTDFLFDAAKAAAEHGLTFFLLGSTEDINARAAAKVTDAGVTIVGRRNGYFTRAEETAIVDAINASGADVLWVGLGVPFEYEFCLRNKSRLKVGWVITCGGCFNFAAGDYQRAPVWMQKCGREWAFRRWR